MKTSSLRIFVAAGLLSLGAGIFVRIAGRNNAGQLDLISYWAAGQQLIHGSNPNDAAEIMELEGTAGHHLDYRLIMRNSPDALSPALPPGLVSANTGNPGMPELSKGSRMASDSN